MKLHSFLNRIFGHAEEINGHNRCETYLYRWILASTRWFKIYLHHFVGNDWSRDLHDHPKRFISIGLWGHYFEQTPAPSLKEDWSNENGAITIIRKYSAPWIRTFPATHIHRIQTKDCWTLVIVLKSEREWGFWHRGRFIHWRSYVNGPDSAIADKMKDCQ